MPPANVATFRSGSSSRTNRSGYQSMPRSANATSSASDASGDGGMGTGIGITSEISDRSRSPRAAK